MHVIVEYRAARLVQAAPCCCGELIRIAGNHKPKSLKNAQIARVDIAAASPPPNLARTAFHAGRPAALTGRQNHPLVTAAGARTISYAKSLTRGVRSRGTALRRAGSGHV